MVTKQQIIIAAAKVAERGCYTDLIRHVVAREAGVTDSVVSYHCYNMDELKNEVIRHALRTWNYPILAQALIRKHPLLRDISPELKENILASI